MKSKFMYLLGAAALAVALGSCNIIIEGPPWPPVNTVDISTGTAEDVQDSSTVNSGQSVVYRLNRSGGSSGVVYVELDTGDTTLVELEVLNAARQVLFSSRSRHVFGAGLTGLDAAAEAALGPQAIVTNVACRGACVIIPASQFGSTLYARVTNDGFTRDVGIYFFDDDYMDNGEPDNNDGPGAPDLSASEDFGAIETVGDVDYFYVIEQGNVTFAYLAATGNNVPIVLDVFNAAQALETTLQPGQSFQLLADDRLRARAANPTQAGVSASSGYRLSYPFSLEGANVVPRGSSD